MQLQFGIEFRNLLIPYSTLSLMENLCCFFILSFEAEEIIPSCSRYLKDGTMSYLVLRSIKSKKPDIPVNYSP